MFIDFIGYGAWTPVEQVYLLIREHGSLWSRCVYWFGRLGPCMFIDLGVRVPVSVEQMCL